MSLSTLILLNLLTENEFAIKDSFEDANRIQTIPNELFDEGYKFIKRHIFVY